MPIPTATTRTDRWAARWHVASTLLWKDGLGLVGCLAFAAVIYLVVMALAVDLDGRGQPASGMRDVAGFCVLSLYGTLGACLVASVAIRERLGEPNSVPLLLTDGDAELTHLVRLGTAAAGLGSLAIVSPMLAFLLSTMGSSPLDVLLVIAGIVVPTVAIVALQQADPFHHRRRLVLMLVVAIALWTTAFGVKYSIERLADKQTAATGPPAVVVGSPTDRYLSDRILRFVDAAIETTETVGAHLLGLGFDNAWKRPDALQRFRKATLAQIAAWSVVLLAAVLLSPPRSRSSGELDASPPQERVSRRSRPSRPLRIDASTDHVDLLIARYSRDAGWLRSWSTLLLAIAAFAVCVGIVWAQSQSPPPPRRETVTSGLVILLAGLFLAMMYAPFSLDRVINREIDVDSLSMLLLAGVRERSLEKAWQRIVVKRTVCTAGLMIVAAIAAQALGDGQPDEILVTAALLGSFSLLPLLVAVAYPIDRAANAVRDAEIVATSPRAVTVPPQRPSKVQRRS